ncbi:hypothetical protein DERP_003839, partial [Dermatophagoides pteronyssinus]
LQSNTGHSKFNVKLNPLQVLNHQFRYSNHDFANKFMSNHELELNLCKVTIIVTIKFNFQSQT